MITIYHNPRCQKSRQAKQFLEDKSIPFEMKLYLKEGLTVEEINSLSQQLSLEIIDMVRQGEDIWKQKYKEQTLTNQDIAKAIVEHPKLLQRPIVSYKNKAVIARPAELIDALLD